MLRDMTCLACGRKEKTDSYGLCDRCQILFSVYIKSIWEKNETELFNQWLNEYRNEVLEGFLTIKKSIIINHLLG